ncbi:SMP-30/gluconolactonase/LRE family protein [Nocardioides marmoriginsengisoli]|uniref:SMP-30/gluconolactonase/LRE family protein n=1 Tax=Nocardioides marmoriginsengisoli TaxID=661483 RepID=A0A3N0CG53_9ACTN|nr:SMP-30/gluconolactonase/LRE family protein [Nocardioides marmoriginsengisoli]RNL62450.1 SMP-30/gluconolactonase/LRE family protein [Nocardioides marmoriginsengisoli]
MPTAKSSATGRPDLDLETEVRVEGLLFPEGPVVLPSGDLVVCELAGRRVTRIDARGGKRTLATFAGSPNGQVVAPDGSLWVCDNGGRWVAESAADLREGPGDQPGLLWRLTLDGDLAPLLTEIDGRPLTSPNDLCLDGDGGLWFTDPVWPDADGQVSAGKIGYRAADGRAHYEHEGLRFPNGLAVTAAGDALIVAESYTSWLHRFPILGPGRLGQPEPFAFLGEGTLPDGLCFDSAGRVIVAGAGTGCVVVFTADGEDLGRIPFGNDVTNVCFGGSDLRTLFVTEVGLGRVSTVRWDVPGLPMPYQLGWAPRDAEAVSTDA